MSDDIIHYHFNPCSILRLGLHTTARKTVTCPRCIKLMGPDPEDLAEILRSDLAPVFLMVAKEYTRSVAEHGNWAGKDDRYQFEAIDGEMVEWMIAHNAKNIDGEHGEIAEAIQCANVFCKRVAELLRRKDNLVKGEMQ